MAAYSTAGNAAFRITGFHLGAAAYLGKIRSSFEKIVIREPIQTDAINTPEKRPVDNIDARSTIEYLAWDTNLPETTTPGTSALAFSEVDGTASGSQSFAPMVPSGYRAGIQRRNGGNPMAQDLELVGTALVELFSF